MGEGGHGDPPPRIRDYPYIVVRVECSVCGRKGAYRLADLAERYGAVCTLDDLLEHLRKVRRPCAWPLPWTIPKRRKMQMVCHIQLPDWWFSRPPPDTPPEGGVRLVVNNEAAE